METSCTYLPYQQTRSFSTIVTDYLQQDEKLTPFYNYPPNLEGISRAIEERKGRRYDRSLLVKQLREQYRDITLTEKQELHLRDLLHEHTFTICTAHQPNIFTGHLYFIYKILHAIKLADTLQLQFPECKFVPVYYMGSEDADLDELGHIIIQGKEYKWNTNQSGAVGRMKVDKAFIALINEMQGQLGVLPNGNELINLFKEAYQLGRTIQQSTLHLVNELFKELGLLVLIPDDAELKKCFNDIVKKELTSQFSQTLVQQTASQLAAHYKVQASGRPINLFYLLDDSRERIEKNGDLFSVVNTTRQWSEAALLQEVDEHPERFSANVILRGVFQEMILPNIAFIGGGGELAYWLELKDVFAACSIPFPVLVLRNSFLLIDEKHEQQATKLQVDVEQLFAPASELLEAMVRRNKTTGLSLADEIQALHELYKTIENKSGRVDSTLVPHVQSLQVRQQKLLAELEKKILRAEKRKYESERRQIEKLKADLFPNNSLQERVENFSFYFGLYGQGWITKVYEASLSLEQQFCILSFHSPAGGK